MNCVQCPECGASEVPAQSNSCPDCGYPIVTLSGFNIRERLREVPPEAATEPNQGQPTTPGVSKGNKLKSKFSRAKDALAKKGKSKKSLEEIVLPQIALLPTERNESSSNDPLESQQAEQEPQEQAILQPEVGTDRITLAESDEQAPQIVEEPVAILEPKDMDVEPAAVPQPDRMVVEPAAIPQPDRMDVEPAAVPEPDRMVVEPAAVPEPDRMVVEPAAVPEPDRMVVEPAAVLEPERMVVEPAAVLEPERMVVEPAAVPEPERMVVEPAAVPEPERMVVEPAAVPEPERMVVEPAAILEPEIVDLEPTAKPNEAEVTSEHEEKFKPALINHVQYEPSRASDLQLFGRDKSQSNEAFQCYECGREVNANANFCPNCHASLLRRICPACRQLVEGNTSFCAFCGAPATALAEPPRNFTTIFAVLMIAFTAVAIYLAKDFIFEDPTLDENLAKIETEKSTPPVADQTNVVLPKRVDNSSPVKKPEVQPPSGTKEGLPNKDGLIETTIGEDGSVPQDSVPQQPSQVKTENQEQQSVQKPAPVVSTPKENTQRAITSRPTGFNRGQITGIPSYKHRDAGLARYLNSVGYRLIRQRRYEEAVPLLKRSVSYFPDNTKDIFYAYALFNLGHALRMSGHANEAIPILEARMKIDNQRETVRRELAAARVAALQTPPQ